MSSLGEVQFYQLVVWASSLGVALGYSDLDFRNYALTLSHKAPVGWNLFVHQVHPKGDGANRKKPALL